VGVIVSLLALSLGIFLGIQSTRSTRATVAENLEVSVRSLTPQLPGPSMDSLLQDAEETGPTYRNILRLLQNSGRAALRKTTFYTIAKTDSGWIFLADAFEGEDHSELGSKYEIKDPQVQSHLDAALENGSSHDPRLVADEWGVWMSAFARIPGTRLPILVCVDTPASDLRRNEMKVLAGAVLFSLIGALGAALTTRQLVHRTLRKELGRAEAQVDALRKGDLSPQEVAPTRDELEAIGHAVNSTASHLRSVVGAERVEWTEVSRKLSESARLALLVEHNPSPMVVLEPSGTLCHLNAATRSLLALWTRNVCVNGKDGIEALHPDLAGLECGQSREFEACGQIWIFQLQPVVDSDGQQVALQGMFQDITERRASEVARRDSLQLQESLRRQAMEQEKLQHEEEMERSRELARQVSLLLEHVSVLKDGDLTGSTPTLPAGAVAQLAHGLENLVLSLRSQMGELVQRSGELSEHSHTMRDTSLALGTQASLTRKEIDAARTEATQAQNSLDQATLTCSTLLDDIRHLTQSSREAVQAAAQAAAIASDAALQVASLESAGIQIAKVSSLVADIARQTSLLAINAAVEAAHAGQAGAGFAVVATEVQALSARTSEATATIDQSLEDIRNGTQNTTRILSKIDDAVTRIRKLQENVDQALLRQREATGNIAKETNQARDRAHSVETHLALVEKAAHRTGMAAEQGLSQAQGLSEMSSSINELVGRFRT
jgi:methyl-accepting chemotaxis protein